MYVNAHQALHLALGYRLGHIVTLLLTVVVAFVNVLLPCHALDYRPDHIVMLLLIVVVVLANAHPLLHLVLDFQLVLTATQQQTVVVAFANAHQL